jgi:hypothetical protein
VAGLVYMVVPDAFSSRYPSPSGPRASTRMCSLIMGVVPKGEPVAVEDLTERLLDELMLDRSGCRRVDASGQNQRRQHADAHPFAMVPWCPLPFARCPSGSGTATVRAHSPRWTG